MEYQLEKTRIEMVFYKQKAIVDAIVLTLSIIFLVFLGNVWMVPLILMWLVSEIENIKNYEKFKRYYEIRKVFVGE